MFFLPITRSPGEHGTEDHTGGVIAQIRRAFRQTVHMGVNGFIACALLSVIPAEVWVVEPGYALIVCLGLVTISASILFSLKSLLTQPSREMVRKPAPGAPDALPQASDIPSPECHSRLVALVVEASRTMQTIVEKSLAKSGIVAVCVASEAGAEKALQTGKFDLLILGAAFG